MHRFRASIVTIALLVAACGGDSRGPGEDGDEGGGDEGGGDEGGGASSAEAAEPPGWDVIEESRIEPIAIDDEPLWGNGSGGPRPFVGSAAFVRDAVIIYRSDDDAQSARSLVAADAATGEVRWSLDELDRLPGSDGGRAFTPSHWLDGGPVLINADGEWAVLVGFRATDPDSRASLPGVAALSAESGEVLWATRLVPALPEIDADRADYLLANLVADGSTVAAVVTVEPRDAPGEAPVETVFALDAVDGTVRWAESDLPPRGLVSDQRLTMAGGSVLLHVAAQHEGDEQAGRPGGSATVVALDAATGATRWERIDSSERLDFRPAGTLVVAAGDVVVVQVPAEDGSGTEQPPETVVLDAATGDELASFGSTASRCVSDGESLIACQVVGPDSEPRLASFDIHSRGTGVSAHALPESHVLQGAAQGRIFVTDGEGAPAALDRVGNVLDEYTPGFLIAMSDRYAMFGTPDDTDTGAGYTVHQVAIGRPVGTGPGDSREFLRTRDRDATGSRRNAGRVVGRKPGVSCPPRRPGGPRWSYPSNPDPHPR